MESYWQSTAYYNNSPVSSAPYYAHMSTPCGTYCYCCCSSTQYSQPMPMSPPAYNNYISSPTSVSYQPQPVQITTPSPSTLHKRSSTNKSTRLQYSNKAKYILNELFKRTPYPNGIQRDIIARKLGISQEQIRIWFQNRRRIQTQREAGERLESSNEVAALQHGKSHVERSELKSLIDDVIKYKNAPPRSRLDNSS